MFDFEERTYKLIGRLRILGTWYNNNHKIDSYLLYSIFLNIYYNLHNLAQAANIFYNYNDMDELTSSGLLTLTEILTNVKAYYIIKNEARILRIHEMVKNPMLQPRNSFQEEKAKSTFSTFDKMLILHSLGPTLTIFFLACYPITEIRKHRKLPFNAWYPYDYKISPLFELTYFHQITGAAIMAHIHINSDCMAFNLIAIIISQLDFLKDSLRNLGKKQIHESIQISQERRRAGFYECMKHHKEILSCFHEVYEMLNVNLMAQFIVTTTSICLTSLQLSLMNPTSTRFMALLIYEFAIMGQLFMFCWWGNELIYKSQEIPQAAFETGWIESSSSFKKDLMFFIQRTQKPLVLYAVDFFRISLGSFSLSLAYKGNQNKFLKFCLHVRGSIEDSMNKKKKRKKILARNILAISFFELEFFIIFLIYIEPVTCGKILYMHFKSSLYLYVFSTKSQRNYISKTGSFIIKNSYSFYAVLRHVNNNQK